jgi:hypothetical protein
MIERGQAGERTSNPSDDGGRASRCVACAARVQPQILCHLLWIEAAAALGVEPERVFKTLIISVDQGRRVTP